MSIETSQKSLIGGTKSLAWMLITGGIVGWIGALALTIERLNVAANPDAVLSCDISPFISCKSVMLTEQASLLGFPNSLIGLAVFVVPILIGFAILAGALIGCFGIALGSDAILTYLCTNGSLPVEIGSRVCGGV